jgi:hypothetical protein
VAIKHMSKLFSALRTPYAPLRTIIARRRVLKHHFSLYIPSLSRLKKFSKVLKS